MYYSQKREKGYRRGNEREWTACPDILCSSLAETTHIVNVRVGVDSGSRSFGLEQHRRCEEPVLPLTKSRVSRSEEVGTKHKHTQAKLLARLVCGVDSISDDRPEDAEVAPFSTSAADSRH